MTWNLYGRAVERYNTSDVSGRKVTHILINIFSQPIETNDNKCKSINTNKSGRQSIRVNKEKKDDFLVIKYRTMLYGNK